MPLTRNKTFRPEAASLPRTATQQLQESEVNGPIRFLNPTHARLEARAVTADRTDLADEQPNENSHALDPISEASTAEPPVETKWTSRDSRKGRQTLMIRADTQAIVPPATSSWTEVAVVLKRMFTSFPVGNISYLVALMFTIGSLIWVLNGVFVFTPLIESAATFPGEIIVGGGATAFIGGCVFLVGSLLLMLEAVNADRASSFG